MYLRMDKHRLSYTYPFIFKYLKFIFLSLMKNQNKILDIANVVYYECVKSQYEVLNYPGYAKMIKYTTKLYSAEMCTIRYKICQILLFLYSLEY
jgi:hypothetical protein